MNKITIKVGNKAHKVEAPESWDDLDDRTAMLFYSTLFGGRGDEFTRNAFTAVKLISLTMHVLKTDPAVLAQWEAACLREFPEHGQTVFLEELKQVIHAALGGLFDIITDDEAGATGYAVRFNRTRNLFPSLAHTTTPPRKKNAPPKPAKTVWYYAPKDGLENITLYEMGYAFSLYETYLQTGETQYADQLIAALYRPGRPETQEERDSAWHGDRRQPLRRYEDKVAERAKLVATMPMLTRRLIVFWFAGCREKIARAYPKVFKRSGEDAGGANYGWGGLLLRLAETGTFGGLDSTADQHYSNALTYLSMKEDDRMEMEKEMAKRRRK